jgi:prepilin-type N-terminal cleavage/methylation domain-containing protein
MKTRLGFTLLEVVVAMIILMIMASMAVPPVTAWRHHAEVRGASDQFRASVALARATAVRMGRSTRLVMHPATRRVWVEVERTPAARDTVGGIRHLSPGLVMSASRDTICFDARGLRKFGAACGTPDTVRISFSSAGRADTVRTDRIGRVIR